MTLLENLKQKAIKSLKVKQQKNKKQSAFVGLCINKLKQKAMQSLKEKRIRFNKIMMKSKFIFVLVRKLNREIQTN
jgi:hypothetical protein